MVSSRRWNLYSYYTLFGVLCYLLVALSYSIEQPEHQLLCGGHIKCDSTPPCLTDLWYCCRNIVLFCFPHCSDRSMGLGGSWMSLHSEDAYRHLRLLGYSVCVCCRMGLDIAESYLCAYSYILVIWYFGLHLGIMLYRSHPPCPRTFGFDIW